MPSLFNIHDAIMSANPEADVYIVLISSNDTFRVIPYWECDLDAAGLADLSITESARFAEETGMGYVTSHIIDMRELRKVAEATS